MTRSFSFAALVSLVLGASALSADVVREWRPKERWRGFNLEGYGLKGSFSGRIEEDDMRWIREFGFNFVRIMVDHHYLMSDADLTKPDAAKFGFLDEAIAMGRRHGLHVNLCLSIPPGVDYKVTRSKAVLFDDLQVQKVLADYWRFIAARYRGVPNDDLSFNLFNEPNTEPKDDEYVRLIARCLKAIREEDPGRFVIADGLNNGRRPEPGATVFGNLAQSLHAYEPMSVSHHRAPWCKAQSGFPAWPPPPVVTPVFGSRKPAELRRPIVIRDVPACRLTVKVGLVNRGGEVFVRADGRELVRRLYVPKGGEPGWTNLTARSGGEWAGQPLEPIVVDLPACARLEIGVGTGDWLGIDRIAFAADGRCSEVVPFFDYGAAQRPRSDVWFAGFDGPAVAANAEKRPETGADWLGRNVLPEWDRLLATGQQVVVGEFGFYCHTPHEIGLRWLEDNLREFKARGLGWALWNFRGGFGVLDSNRKDVDYEDFHGHKLDRKLLDLLQRY